VDARRKGTLALIRFQGPKWFREGEAGVGGPTFNLILQSSLCVVNPLQTTELSITADAGPSSGSGGDDDAAAVAADGDEAAAGHSTPPRATQYLVGSRDSSPGADMEAPLTPLTPLTPVSLFAALFAEPLNRVSPSGVQLLPATPSSLVPRGLDNAAGDAELLRNLQAELEESARGGMQEQQEKEQVEHSVPAQDAAEVEAELDLLGFSPTFDPPSTMSSAIAPIDRSRKPYPGTNINSS
jgi:hypothetical protein